MRAFILPVAVILSLGAASLALASTTTDGVIKSFDMKTHTLVLADGVSYVLPNGFKAQVVAGTTAPARRTTPNT